MRAKLLLLLAFTLLAITGYAQTTLVASGTCGTNLTWTLTSDSTLTISGTGAMTDYTYGYTPWDEYWTAIETVDIQDGVTLLGTMLFTLATS